MPYSNNSNGQTIKSNPDPEQPAFNQTNPPQTQIPQQAQYPLQSQQNNNPTQLPQHQFVNPNNFNNILPPESVVYPENSPIKPENPTVDDLRMVSKVAGVEPMPIDHRSMMKTGKIVVEKNEMLKLVVYVIPIIAIFFLLFKSVNDEGLLWHVRQSLVAQAIWFPVLIVIRLLDLPTISYWGGTLWNVGFFIMMLYAGALAYSHERYRLPVVYDVGQNFIEGK